MNVAQKERKTQDRVIKLFQEKLGYTYLGNREDKQNNSNVEEDLLRKFLKKKRYSENLIKRALDKFNKEVSVQNKELYDLNKEIYSMLRYGVKVKERAGENNKTVWLIDWENTKNNDFYIAEEVTIKGKHNKRPDVVLYINGIAVGVLELKRSIVSVGEGIRQNLDNQKDVFIRNFFGTIQLVMAGNDTEGLRYATILTPEKYYLKWKEESDIQNKLDRELSQLCEKERFLEIIHDFIVFDRGVKKICRHNQYFGVKSAQKSLKKKEGGIIWHTQGSGKSLTMIWLAKWIRENIDDSRVLIITDRVELDRQIKKFFLGVNENIYRTKSGQDLINKLNDTEHWLICSLVHKFGRSTETDFDKYLKDIKISLPNNFKPKGDIYIFVDECHRTQSGKLHEAMKEILSNATFIGFTGTPLLKNKKKKSIEVFGRYIHTYKYDEAVDDEVIVDIQYEAREIEQKITSQEKIDQWFEAKTKGLNDFAKAELKKKWGTMNKVLSSQSRLNRIVADVMLDMETKDRLASGMGNALLIAGSIYQACKYYELFHRHGLNKCAIITSYSGDINSIKGETSDIDDETENIQKYKIYQDMIQYYEKLYPDISTKGFEAVIKDKFVNEPGQMKLLIVVDKLLTGFDAPPATYLYIDKNMQDHGLFQAICRVNRLDSEDKEYGYVIDYKDLFKSLNKAVTDYTSEAFDEFDKEDVEGLLKNRLKTAKEKLDDAREKIKALCEPVKPPKDSPAYIEYFCGNTENPEDLKNHEQKRIALYKHTSTFVRSYANIANEMKQAGYSKQETEQIKQEVKYYEGIRFEVKLASGDYIDLKAYEPAMRHLIDSYIDAEESKTVSMFEDTTLIDFIVINGVKAINKLPQNIRNNQKATAEVIENNVRKYIIEKKPTNPKYFEKMSVLLDELIKERKNEALDYKKYLKKIVNLVKKIKDTNASKYPKSISSDAMRALYDNLKENENIALSVHNNILHSRQDDWKGNKMKEKLVRNAIKKAFEEYNITNSSEIDKILKLAINQHEY